MAKSIFINLIGMGFLLLIIDGCPYRDPAVKLPGGYVVAAISNSSPSELYLESNYDAKWRALQSRDEILVSNNEDGTVITVEKLSDIPERITDIDLSEVAPRIDNVVSYSNDQRFIAGRNKDSYFLLDTTTHDCRTWQSSAEWAKAKSEAGMTAGTTSDPKGFLNRWRHPATWPAYAVLLLIAGTIPILSAKFKGNVGDRTNG